MKRWLCTAYLLSFLNTGWAGWNQWTSADKALFVASNIAITADWASTRNLSRRYDQQYKEAGVISIHMIGEQPSTTKVDAYFIVRLALNYVATDWLQDEMRTGYLVLTTIDHGAAAHNNVRLGLKIKF